MTQEARYVRWYDVENDDDLVIPADEKIAAALRALSVGAKVPDGGNVVGYLVFKPREAAQ